MEVTSALHFDHESLVPRKPAAFLSADALDALHGDAIAHISAKGNRSRPESDAPHTYGEVAVVGDDATMSVSRSH
jgi:hypothetical protein